MLSGSTGPRSAASRRRGGRGLSAGTLESAWPCRGLTVAQPPTPLMAGRRIFLPRIFQFLPSAFCPAGEAYAGDTSPDDIAPDIGPTRRLRNITCATTPNMSRRAVNISIARPRRILGALDVQLRCQLILVNVWKDVDIVVLKLQFHESSIIRTFRCAPQHCNLTSSVYNARLVLARGSHALGLQMHSVILRRIAADTVLRPRSPRTRVGEARIDVTLR